MKKERLDILLVKKGLCVSQTEAQALILAGEVWSENQRLEKAGTRYKEDLSLEIRTKLPDFSSRAGYKLDHALKIFSIVVKNRVCIDIGSSTGGFTDCLLKAGAAKIFSVDVGYGLLDQKLRLDSRILVFERTNARNLKLQELILRDPEAVNISLLVADVSFISLFKVLEPLSQELIRCQDWIVLFKPQFEVGPEHLGKGGRVKDIEISKKMLEEFDASMKQLGFERNGKIEPSPMPGKKSGNVEYLLHYSREPK